MNIYITHKDCQPRKQEICYANSLSDNFNFSQIEFLISIEGILFEIDVSYEKKNSKSYSKPLKLTFKKIINKVSNNESLPSETK